MAKTVDRSVSRSRRLTRSEAAKYRRIREEAHQNLPPAKPDPVNVAIAKHRVMPEPQGVTLAESAGAHWDDAGQRGPTRSA